MNHSIWDAQLINRAVMGKIEIANRHLRHPHHPISHLATIIAAAKTTTVAVAVIYQQP